MIESDFDRIERELGITLPAVYREMVLGRPFLAGGITRQVAFVDDVDELLAVNRECRRSGHPRTHFAIGFAEDAARAYGLDLTRDPPPVIAMAFAGGPAREEAPDLHAWIAELSKAAPLAAAGRGGGAAATAVAARRAPWWRFWSRG
jgi:hypothetical protein